MILNKTAFNVAWKVIEVYLDDCSDGQNNEANKVIFSVIHGFGLVLGAMFAASLLGGNKQRIGLYILLTLLIVNALVLQICTCVT